MPHPTRPDRRPPAADPEPREPGRPLAWLPRSAVRLGLLTLVAVAVAVLVGAPLRGSSVVYTAGEIAQEDVVANRDLLLPDPVTTEHRRREAEAGSPAVYDFNPAALAEALAGLRAELTDDAEAGLGFDALEPLGEGAARQLRERWGLPPSPGPTRGLARSALVAGVQSALEGLYARGVVANRRLLAAEGKRGTVVRNLATREEAPLGDPAAVEDFDEARRRLLAAEGSDPVNALAMRLAGSLLRPNLSYNSEETAARRSAAREAVRPVLVQIARGEALVRSGDRVSAEQAQRLAAHAARARDRGGWVAGLGVFGLSALTLGALFRFGRSNVKKFRSTDRDLCLLAALLVALLAAERAGLVVVAALAGAVPAGAQGALAYALPLAAATVAARVVLNSETALLFGLPLCAFAALPFEDPLGAFLLFAAGSLLGAHRAARACHRLEFLRAGAWAGLGQTGAAVALALMQGDGGVELAWAGGAAFAGGLTSGVLALGLVPLAEWCFGYTTEMRLTELGSLDHPVLRELMLRAPGTYYHSIVTGSLVKAAAEAIGARALLATVAAYYHDIGKLSKPAYFIENQTEGVNLHDKLAPSMSALILMSHVKEGVELARRHHLGQDLVDIVQQHHGTSLIQYFYGRARERARRGVEAVQESDYRYPGPRPQTREAALVLLADAVEAACRSLADPRPSRIQGVVQNIVNRTFADGQLDECDLTLKDLHEIARSFSRILSGIHHQRIDYPLAAHKDRMNDGDLDPKRLRDVRDRRGAAAAPGAEGLKRLGL
ncbi:MAG: HD family phosphohydrolase [Deferrisomatales bacterium]